MSTESYEKIALDIVAWACGGSLSKPPVDTRIERAVEVLSEKVVAGGAGAAEASAGLEYLGWLCGFPAWYDKARQYADEHGFDTKLQQSARYAAENNVPRPWEKPKKRDPRGGW